MTPEEKAFVEKLNLLVNDEQTGTSLIQRIITSVKKPSNAQKLGQNAFFKTFLQLLTRAVLPFSSSSKAALGGAFFLQNTSIDHFLTPSDQKNNDEISNKATISLTNEVCSTMPEIEREMKSDTLGKDINTISSLLPSFINSKFSKYSSLVGIVISGIALASLNPILLSLAAPSYILGQYISYQHKKNQTLTGQPLRRANIDVFRKTQKAINNPELHRDQKKQDKEIKQAQKNLSEIKEIVSKKQKRLSLLFSMTTTLLTGGVLITHWGTMTLPTLVGLYAATNTFLSSVGFCINADHRQKNILHQLIESYNKIKHQPEFNLKTGNQKLPQNVDTIHIDKIVYSYRTSINVWKTTKKPPDAGGLNFWYSRLSEYRVKHLEDFKKLAQEIELLKI